MNVPQLRFSWFSGEWHKAKLENLAGFFKGAILSKEDLSKTGLPCILYGELYTKYEEIAINIHSKTECTRDKMVFSKAKDVLVPSSGETAIDIAKATCVLQSGVALGGDLNIIRSSKVDGRILSYIFNGKKKSEIASFAQGKSIVHISAKALKNILISFPSIPEQQKIAEFLSAIDEKINNQQNIIASLEVQKKGFIQKIFSQQLRFKDNNGGEFPEWEEKNFAEIFNGFEYGMNAAAGEFDGTNKYIRITDIDEFSHKYIGEEPVSPMDKLEDKYRVKENDILFARTGASTGKTYLYNCEDGILYYAGFLIRGNVKTKYDSRFIFAITLLHEYDKWISIESTRSGQPGINAQQFASFSFACPSLPEQEKIADFLSVYDEKIDTEKQIATHWKTIKKALLQQMFV